MQTCGPSTPDAKAFDGPFFRSTEVAYAGVAIPDIEFLFESGETSG